jgi:CRP/FNR family transcriptional regulator, cyclic AMP receptor protein
MAIADDLKRVPLFSDLDGRQLKKLADLFRERTLEPGVSVVQEGTMSGVGFFVIADGEASVSRDGNELATLGPGDYFGELALLDPAPRDATVTATAPSNLLVLSRKTFTAALDEIPTLRDALLHGMARRIHELDGRY